MKHRDGGDFLWRIFVTTIMHLLCLKNKQKKINQIRHQNKATKPRQMEVTFKKFQAKFQKRKKGAEM